jgi:ribosome-associated translation inhibitor RaiA
MRIEVLAEHAISVQARSYAEYRLFAVLSQAVDTSRVRHARLALRRIKPLRGCERVSCTVTIELDRDDIFRIRTTGDHEYAAINRAMERLSAGRWPITGDRPRTQRAAAE